MKPFLLARPTTVAKALELGGRPGAMFLAGGTTLVDLMKLGIEKPDSLVDIGALALSDIEALPDGGLRIGALVRNSTVAGSALIGARYPALQQAVAAGASPQLRNMATVGGNLLQRTRCPYFRDAISACNQRLEGSGCAAVGGVDRMHAVLGTSDRCIAVYPGDMAVALVALDATVQLLGPDGTVRSVPVTDFCVSYGDDPARRTVLEAGELVTAIDLPATEWFARSTYLKVRGRAEYDFALASAAVALDLDGVHVRAARIGLGGVATKPWRSTAAEDVLVGAHLGASVARAAAEAALAGARPGRHNGFKIELVKRTITRAILAASVGSGGAGEW